MVLTKSGLLYVIDYRVNGSVCTKLKLSRDLLKDLKLQCEAAHTNDNTNSNIYTKRYYNPISIV